MHALADLADKLRRGIMFFAQRDEDVRVRCTRDTGIRIGQIDSAIGQSDVINNPF